MANEYIRKQSVGGVVQTTTTNPIDSDDTAINIASTIGWPSGSTPFVITLERNLAAEETILVTRTGSTLTAVNRGYDGTLAQAHAAGVSCIHSFDAHSADQNNRYVNLQQVKGSLVIHNGTNPVEFDPELVGDGSDDGFVMFSQDAAESGWTFGPLPPVHSDPSAPNVATTRYYLWFDETLKILRTSDGAQWQLPAQLLAFASKAARAAALPAPFGGLMTLIGDTIIEYYDDTANIWKTVGVPEFLDTTARDAYYTSPYDGARAYCTIDSTEWTYRTNEWILANYKVVVSATAPVDPHVGDIWLEPVA